MISDTTLTENEVEYARKHLGREPNSLEWQILEAEWSEHCSYKSSRRLLKQLPSKGPRVLVGPGFDAGILDIGGGYVVALHVESHNHPSAIDPYGGAATGVGGILRDIIGVGARPIALVDCLSFGLISKSDQSRWLLKNVVRGISDYGNSTGVPTVCGEVQFDPCFETNCLVDVACVGIGLKSEVHLGQARYGGESLILVGGSTGRDGIRGSSFASNVLKKAAAEDRSAVQVADPFMGKLLIESTLEVAKTGLVSGIKDLGGGGLATALSEIAEKGGKGITIDLDRVHLREPGMDASEIMISESQERMVFVVKRNSEGPIRTILDKYEIPYSRIGQVSNDGNMRVFSKGKELACLPAKLIARSPEIKWPSKPPMKHDKATHRVECPADLGKILVKLLSSEHIASRRWIYEQYDHEVGVRSVIKPGHADCSILRLPNGKFLALKADSNSRHCDLDPYQGSLGCVSESCRNLVTLGATPIGLVDHLQFGNPGDPLVFWAFEKSVKAIADYCRALNIPCVGGKVSFYNEDSKARRRIKSTPLITTIGLMDNAPKTRRSVFSNKGSIILLVGQTFNELGGSQYYEYIHGISSGHVPKVHLGTESNTFDHLLKFHQKGFIRTAHDCSKGGLGVALAEMSLGTLGATVDCSGISKSMQDDEVLFSESHGRFLLEVDPEHVTKVRNKLLKGNVPSLQIGSVGGASLSFQGLGKRNFALPLDEIADAYEQALPMILGDVK
ncbi:MAG: phosphoribosylformylglycinamidine synthase subunit PurL [Nitrososphaerales archaeon]